LAEPLVRRWSNRDAGPPRDDAVAEALIRLVADSDAQVRLQLAYSLGEWTDPRAADGLVALTARNPTDPFLASAVLSSATPHVGRMLSAALALRERQPVFVATLLALAVATKNDEGIATALEAIAADASPKRRGERFYQLTSFLDVLSRRGTPLSRFREQSSQRVKEALAKAMSVLDEARGTLADGNVSVGERVAAIDLLGWDDAQRATDVRTLGGLLSPQTSMPLQLAAVAALARLDDAAVEAELFGRWKTFGPQLRSAVIEEALARPAATKALLGQLQSGKIAVGELNAAKRDRLRNHPDLTVRALATILLGRPTQTSRGELIAKYRPVARAGGDAARGLAGFKKTCANCHRLGDLGTAVGPDLATMADRSPETILAAVLDPNRAVEARYQSYSALLTDGRTLSGILSAETGGSITLLAAEGKKHGIARADLERLESSGRSLMPDGIEKDLSPQDLADVIAFLGAQRAPRRQFAGNEPQVIKPTAAGDLPGSLDLTAVVAEIYGQQIVFEQPYKNLGYWSGPQDHALWRIELAKAGRYEVWLDWACEKSAAGNHYILEAGEQTISGRVESTGRWETYRRARIGNLELPAGKTEVTFRPGEGFKGTLIDLRAIQLVPRK
jgi:putative heme-binding domain-containing protein